MKKLYLAFLFLLICGRPLVAQVPGTINFQGTLTTLGTTNPVSDGDYFVTFRVYDDINGTVGTNLWSESHTVTVGGGLFNQILGISTPFDPAIFDRPLFIEMEFEGETFPKIEFTSTPYSIYSKVSQSVIGQSNQVPSSGNVYIGGNQNVGGVAPTIDLAIDDDDTGLEVPADGQLSFYTNGDERMRINETGNVGIGTTTPSEKLSVVGDIVATDTVKADVFHFNTPKESRLFLSGLHFKRVTETGTPYLIGYDRRYLTGGVVGSNHPIVAPFDLPDGAVITSIDIYIYDGDVTYNHGNFYLYATDGTFSGFPVEVDLGSYSGSAGDITIPSGVISVPVNNSQYGFWLWTNMPHSSSIAINGARITYTQPSP